jgi:hypothetical protein
MEFFFITLLFIKYNWNDQVEEDEMGRACSMNVAQLHGVR